MSAHAAWWTAAILAGGQGRRFGGIDKSQLIVDGQTVLDRQLAVLRPLTDDCLLAGGPAREHPATVRHVADLHPGLGPLAGLEAALLAARHDIVVAVACDMPFLDGRLLSHLAELARHHDIVAPQTGRGVHPLCAAYRRACRPAISARLERGQLKLTDLFEEMRVHVVSVTDLEVFGDADQLMTNLNRPDDLAGLQATRLHGEKF